jgi:lysophospholipase L1-like esterase
MKPLLAPILALALSMQPTLAATAPQRIFYSGHSLLDEPLPGGVATIARSLGLPLHWERHTPFGSSMRDRTGSTPPLAGFDTLVVTEQHTLIGNLVWNDSAGQLRQLQDRFVAANPNGRTWFYASWLNLGDRNRPQHWIAYERLASPVWQCLVERVNAARSGSRIQYLPAGALLAALVERVSRGEVPGLRTEALFTDDVHPSPLGAYFMSLAVFATLFDRSPAGAAVPGGLDANVARGLQPLAWTLVDEERARREAVSPAACRERTQRFIAPYAAYVRDVVTAPREGLIKAWWQWARHRAQWHWALHKMD